MTRESTKESRTLSSQWQQTLLIWRYGGGKWGPLLTKPSFARVPLPCEQRLNVDQNWVDLLYSSTCLIFEKPARSRLQDSYESLSLCDLQSLIYPFRNNILDVRVHSSRLYPANNWLTVVESNRLGLNQWKAVIGCYGNGFLCNGAAYFSLLQFCIDWASL